MKIQIVISVIFFIILAIVANALFLKLDTMPFIGILLLASITLGLIGNFAGKANRKRKGIKGEPDAFIFPDGTAKKMKKMDLGIQYETSVLSSSLLMLGIILFLIYFIFFTTSSWIMKGLIIFNSLCGMGLMAGMIVTYYQQLISYRESTKFLKQFAVPQELPQKEVYGSEPEPYNPAEEYNEPYGEEPLNDDEYYRDMQQFNDDQQMKGGDEYG